MELRKEKKAMVIPVLLGKYITVNESGSKALLPFDGFNITAFSEAHKDGKVAPRLVL